MRQITIEELAKKIKDLDSRIKKGKTFSGSQYYAGLIKEKKMLRADLRRRIGFFNYLRFLILG